MSNQNVVFPSPETRPNTGVNMGLVVPLRHGSGVLIFGVIWPFKGTFIRDLFIGRYENDPSRYIFQALITWVWGLSTMTVVLKRFKCAKEFKALHECPIPEDLDMTDTNALVEVYNRLMHLPNMTHRIVYTRVAKVLGMWINTGDFARTAQNAKEDTELDNYLADSSFRANRLFIWAMPLLGFLGTVYGVSYGIGGFAEFLSGEVTAQEIKVQVGIITQGLAVAFYTTLLGLWTAGSAAFPSMGAERREEQLLGEIDEYIQERLISRMPSAKAVEFPVEHFSAMREGISQMASALTEPLRQMVATIEDGFRRLPSPGRYEEIFAAAIARAADMINTKYAEFMIQYEIRIGELGEQLAGKMQGVAEKFHAGSDRIAQELSHQATTIRDAGARQVEQQAAAQGAYLASLEKASEREALRWKEAAADLQRQVGDAGTHLGQAVTALREASSLAAHGADDAARSLAAQMTRLVDVGSRIEQLLQATRAVEVALGDLASTQDFRQAMNDLRSHLQATDDMVKRLSRPRTIVLQEAR
jgi:hypothetical protein